MNIFLIGLCLSYARRLIMKRRTSHFFEYIREIGEVEKEKGHMKSLQIYSVDLSSLKHTELVCSSIFHNDLGSTNNVFSIQGFIDDETYRRLKNCKHILLSINYQGVNKSQTASTFYSVHNIQNGIAFRKGDETTLEDFLLAQIYYVHKQLNKDLLKEMCEMFEKDRETDEWTSTLSVLNTRMLFLKVLRLFEEKMNHSNDKLELLNLLKGMAVEHGSKEIRFNGYVISPDNTSYYNVHLILNDVLKTIEGCIESEEESSSTAGRITLNLDDFIEHSWTVMCKTVLITKMNNLTYRNMIFKKFDEEFKDFVHTQNYKILHNLIIFPLIDSQKNENK